MLQATGYPAEIADFYSAISAGYWGVFLVAKTVQLVMWSEPREGLVVDRAKVVTLFPSYDKTKLSIGLVPGFEPATYRSYATKLTPPADSAVVKYGFLSASCLLTFGIIYGLWRKNYIYLFFFRS